MQHQQDILQTPKLVVKPNDDYKGLHPTDFNRLPNAHKTATPKVACGEIHLKCVHVVSGCVFSTKKNFFG